jgi:hypothetical protein
MTSYAFLPGQGPGLTGLQPPPLDPRQQIQQIMAQGPTQPQRQSGREGYINSILSVAFFNSPEAEQQAREQLGKDYDADPSIYQQQPMGPQQRLRNPRPPKAEGLGVSSFVGASSNDIQRMLNRGSVATGGIDDAQRQMEQVRRDEFLAKMRAQNPERFNDMPSTPPMGGTPPMRPDVDIFPTPMRPQPSTPLPLAGGAPQFPGLDPSIYQTPSSSLVGQGIMGQAPDFMTQYMDMIRSPMQGYGGGGTQMSSAPMNPVGQIPMLPNQVPMQTYGSQNTAPIQSPFA